MKTINVFSLLILFMMIGTTSRAQMNVMTYNVRYANENDGENSWSQRKNRITNQIKFFEPDIFGVQEALLMQMEHFKENLQGYEYLGVDVKTDKNKENFQLFFIKRKSSGC